MNHEEEDLRSFGSFVHHHLRILQAVWSLVDHAWPSHHPGDSPALVGTPTALDEKPVDLHTPHRKRTSADSGGSFIFIYLS